MARPKSPKPPEGLTLYPLSEYDDSRAQPFRWWYYAVCSACGWSSDLVRNKTQGFALMRFHADHCAARVHRLAG